MPIKTATYIEGKTTYEDVLNALNQPQEIAEIINNSASESDTQIFDKLVMAVYGIKKAEDPKVLTWPAGLGEFLAKEGQQKKLMSDLKIAEKRAEKTAGKIPETGEKLLKTQIIEQMNKFKLLTPSPGSWFPYQASVPSRKIQNCNFITTIINTIETYYNQNETDKSQVPQKTSAMLQTCFNESNFRLENEKFFDLEPITEFADINRYLNTRGLAALTEKPKPESQEKGPEPLASPAVVVDPVNSSTSEHSSPDTKTTTTTTTATVTTVTKATTTTAGSSISVADTVLSSSTISSTSTTLSSTLSTSNQVLTPSALSATILTMTSSAATLSSQRDNTSSVAQESGLRKGADTPQTSNESSTSEPSEEALGRIERFKRWVRGLWTRFSNAIKKLWGRQPKTDDTASETAVPPSTSTSVEPPKEAAPSSGPGRTLPALIDALRSGEGVAFVRAPQEQPKQQGATTLRN